jgi:hypothetical protein
MFLTIPSTTHHRLPPQGKGPPLGGFKNLKAHVQCTALSTKKFNIFKVKYGNISRKFAAPRRSLTSATASTGGSAWTSRTRLTTVKRTWLLRERSEKWTSTEANYLIIEEVGLNSNEEAGEGALMWATMQRIRNSIRIPSPLMRVISGNNLAT